MEIKPKGSREKQQETSWHPLEREEARSGELSQPLEENVRRGLGGIKVELDQRHHYLMGKMREDFHNMLEVHQWKTTSTLTKLGGKLGDPGGKVSQLSQVVEDQGSSREEDMARLRFLRKQGPTQKHSTTAPGAPVSNTEGTEEVKNALSNIENALNKPIPSPACDPRAGELEKRLQVLEKNLEEINRGWREPGNHQQKRGTMEPVADTRGRPVFQVPWKGTHGKGLL